MKRQTDERFETVLDNRYRLAELLGEGGFGRVYLGTHIALGKRVAIKVLQQSPEDQRTSAARFQQEARLASSLRHPNIAEVSDYGELPDGTRYLVMELLEGSDLATRLDADGPFSTARCVHIGIQLCKALEVVHAAGIVHRDLKPLNIFTICHDGDADFVKLLDFGIAKIMVEDETDSSAPKTAFRRVIGSPPYVAPERMFGEAYDTRADIFSLGVVLHLLATGSAELSAQGGARPVFHSPSLEQLVRSCVALQPADRYQTVVDVRKGLERVLSAARNEHASSVPPEQTEGPAYAPTLTASISQLQPKSNSTGRRAVAGLALMLPLFAGGYLWLRKTDSNSSPAEHTVAAALPDATKRSAPAAQPSDVAAPAVAPDSLPPGVEAPADAPSSPVSVAKQKLATAADSTPTFTVDPVAPEPPDVTPSAPARSILLDLGALSDATLSSMPAHLQRSVTARSLAVVHAGEEPAYTLRLTDPSVRDGGIDNMSGQRLRIISAHATLRVHGTGELRNLGSFRAVGSGHGAADAVDDALRELAEQVAAAASTHT